MTGSPSLEPTKHEAWIPNHCFFCRIRAEMKQQFGWHILAIILLCICLPFGLCDKNGHRNDRTVANGQNGKFRPQPGIPLRDDNDYIRVNDRNEPHHSTVEDDYDDEYDDDESVAANVGSNENPTNENDENDFAEQSPEIVEQAQSARTQIIQRPKELTDTELAALLKSSPTPSVDSADAQAPSSIETCPKECSCLNDFMTCTRPHLKHLPKVPHFIQSLYVTLCLILILILILILCLCV